MERKENVCIGVSKAPRKVIVYDPSAERTADNKVKCWDGKEYTEYTWSQIRDFGFSKALHSKILPIKREKGLTVEQTYDRYVDEAKQVWYETCKTINMFRCGSYSRTAIDYFFSQMNARGIVPETMGETESMIIDKTDQGQLFYSENYTGPAHEYDIVSMYLSIMSSVNFRVPIKEPDFKRITADEFKKMEQTYFLFGLYHVHIDFKSSKTNYLKQMRMNTRENWYTSDDLTTARQLNIPMKIIEDNDINFLHYGEGKCLKGCEVFKDFADYMINMRKKTGMKVFKIIGNSLWGGLVQKNVKKPIRYDVRKELNLKYPIEEDKITITKQGFVSDYIYQIDYHYKSKMFRYDWARMKPFILSKGRQKIFRIVEPYIDHVKRINTDGFLSDVELPLEIGTDKGDLKYESYKKRVTIVHLNNILDWSNPDDFKEVLKYYENKSKIKNKELIHLKESKYMIL